VRVDVPKFGQIRFFFFKSQLLMFFPEGNGLLGLDIQADWKKTILGHS
jgi:hypothetical protein